MLESPYKFFFTLCDLDYQETNTTINVDDRIVEPHNSAKRLLLS